MSIYGGETIKESAKRLESAPIDIICATPGRLIALLDETKCLDAKHSGARRLISAYHLDPSPVSDSEISTFLWEECVIPLTLDDLKGI